jgi:hypothetical protein
MFLFLDERNSLVKVLRNVFLRVVFNLDSFIDIFVGVFRF